MIYFRTCCIKLLTVTLLLVSAASLAKPRDIDPELLEKLVERLAEPYEDVDRFDAEVWLHASDQRLKRFIHRPQSRLKVLQSAYREALHHDLDPDLVLAVIHIESAFDRFAISRVGAQGLMQVMPFWRVEIGRPKDNLTEVDTNIRYGTAILAHYLEVSRGDLVDALGRYNGSRGRLRYPDKVVGAWRRVWRNTSLEDVPALQASCRTYALNACRYR